MRFTIHPNETYGIWKTALEVHAKKPEVLSFTERQQPPVAMACTAMKGARESTSWCPVARIARPVVEGTKRVFSFVRCGLPKEKTASGRPSGPGKTACYALVHGLKGGAFSAQNHQTTKPKLLKAGAKHATHP